LSRNDFQDDRVLVEALIDTITDHKGFALDETTFTSWLSHVNLESEKSGFPLQDLEGEWRRRIDAHLSKVKSGPISNPDSQDAAMLHSNPSEYFSLSSPTTLDITYTISDDDWRKAAMAVEKNNKGAEAFTARERGKALEQFTQAIDDMLDVLSRNREVKRIHQNLAMTYANRANALLMDGIVEDVDAALHDAEQAEKFDPALNFGYV
jgi:hypothetical protein